MHFSTKSGQNNAVYCSGGNNMKKQWFLALVTLILILSTAITVSYAINESDMIEIISKDEIDLTGNGKKDTVIVKGELFEAGAAFLKNIFVVIQGSNGKEYTLTLDGGYEPTVRFEDLNHDGIKDLFISVATGGSGGLSNYNLYTLKDFKLTDLTVPDPLIIQSEFLDDYKGKITIEDTNKTYIFDLKDRREDYERIGLYHNGKLNEPSELMVLPFGRLKIIPVEGEKLGLKGVQRISGAYNADGIAYVESTWLYDQGKWNLKDTKVMELDPKRSTKK